jgi:hypothetical protein
MSQQCDTTAQWANIPLTIQNSAIQRTMVQYPITMNAQYTCSLNVNIVNVKSLYECAICARTSAYHKHPFEVEFDDNATCTSVLPPPISHSTIGDGVKPPPQTVTAGNWNARGVTGD